MSECELDWRGLGQSGVVDYFDIYWLLQCHVLQVVHVCSIGTMPNLFFNDSEATEYYSLSLGVALPVCRSGRPEAGGSIR